MTLLLLCLQGVLGSEHHIKSESELIAFSNNRNTFLGTTVLLDVDIDFAGGLSEQFQPIGNDINHYFQGVFDG